MLNKKWTARSNELKPHQRLEVSCAEKWSVYLRVSKQYDEARKFENKAKRLIRKFERQNAAS